MSTKKPLILNNSYVKEISSTDNIGIINGVDFATDNIPIEQTSRLQWDSGNQTLQVGLNANVNLQIGQEIVVLCHNEELTTLNAGEIVYITGAQGNRISVKRAKADSESTSSGTLGMVTEPILSGSVGFITILGCVNHLDTTTYTAGTLLYLSDSVAGSITATKPIVPSHSVRIGYVQRVHATIGSIFVKVDNGYEIDELHNVKITSLNNGHILKYNSTLGYWENVADNSITLTSLSVNSPLSYNNANGQFSIQQANISQNGYLSSSDWNTFNNKQNSLGFTPEDVSNKVTSMSGNETSNIKYPTIKLLYDWATELFLRKNNNIVSSTKTKITYDVKGLVTSGQDATTSDIADSLNKRYVTDAQLSVLSNTTGVNTGDQIISDATLTTSDITTNNFSITKHGFVPKGTNIGNFLKDDGTWSVVTGFGDMFLANSQTISGLKTFLNATFGLRNVSNTFTSYFTNTNTASRTYTLQDKSQTLAGLDDILTPLIVAISDETTTLTTGTSKVTFRAPYAMTLTQIPRASVNTASTSGLPTFDIKINGTSIFSTLLTINANEKTSKTAATAAVLATTTIADDAEITIDISIAGTGTKGAKITFYWRKT